MRLRLSLALALLVVLLVPAASAVASGRDVLRDCSDDEVLSRTYTQKEYRDALSRLATDSSEYSGCEAVIRAAQLQQAAGRDRGSSGGSGGSGGSGSGGTGSSGTGGTGGTGGTAGGTTGTPGQSGGTGSRGAAGSGTVPAPPPRTADPLGNLTFDERVALDQARAGGGNGVQGSLRVAPPGASRAPGETGTSDLPGPVLGLLVLLAGALVVATGARVRTRVLDRRAA